MSWKETQALETGSLLVTLLSLDFPAWPPHHVGLSQPSISVCILSPQDGVSGFSGESKYQSFFCVRKSASLRQGSIAQAQRGLGTGQGSVPPCPGEPPTARPPKAAPERARGLPGDRSTGQPLKSSSSRSQRHPANRHQKELGEIAPILSSAPEAYFRKHIDPAAGKPHSTSGAGIHTCPRGVWPA